MINNELAYPIIFSRIPMKKLWGGTFIKQIISEDYTNQDKVYDKLAYGELWLLSDRQDYQSTIINGSLQGVTLSELWSKYKKEVFGLNNNTTTFPLLVKIIDADDDLSLQVHPKEEDLPYLSNAEAKTEMWYVLRSEADAKILAGFNNSINNINRDIFIKLLNEPHELKKYINHYISISNKYFFIPAGTIHSIGKGNIVFEIQQNSDTTYRVSDWNRLDSTGKNRELHIQESLQSLNFNSENILTGIVNFKDNFIYKEITPHNKYFQMYICNIYKNFIINTFKGYKLLTLISGEVQIIVCDKIYNISKYFTVLLPFGCEFQIIPITKQATLISYF